MPVSEIMSALYGSYQATGVYSCEFRNRRTGSRITEIFFMLPPESVRVKEAQRATLTPTLGGGYIADHGQEFKDISVSGSSHFYYAGTSAFPARQAGATNGSAPDNYIDGFTEFLKLRYMLIRYRDYVMTPGNKLIAPAFGNEPDLAGINGLKSFVANQIDNGAGALADDVEVIWHDYDYDDHFKVKVNSYEASRAKDDPWTVGYDLQMQGYEVDDRASSAIIRAANIKKKTPYELMQNVNDQANSASFETLPSTTPTESPSTNSLGTSVSPPLPNSAQAGNPTTNAVAFSLSSGSLTGDPTISGLAGLNTTNQATDTLILPVEVQQNAQLIELNEHIRNLRSQYAAALAKTQTGAFSIKRAFGIIVEDLLTALRQAVSLLESLIVPKEQFMDFTDGLVTLDQFGSFEVMAYYNGLRKLIVIYTQAQFGLQQLTDIPQRPVQPPNNAMQTGVLDTLDDSEFLDQGYGSPVNESLPKYSYYTIRQGDTLQSIAVKVYNGNVGRWPDLSAANNLLESDLIDLPMVGTTIKVPIDRTASSPLRASQNLVYEPVFDGADQAQIERFLHGADIAAPGGQFVVGSDGDLGVVSGVQNTIQAINDRLNNIRGSLNPIHADWGIELPNDYAQVPYAIALDRTLTAMEGQAASDPRVLFAVIDRKNLRIDGDAMKAEMTIRLIGGSTERETFGVPSL